jgi:hypothetical protein
MRIIAGITAFVVGIAAGRVGVRTRWSERRAPALAP